MGKPFTELEAALLLDAYIKVQDGVLSRAEAVRSCSAELRQMAVNSGVDIDDSFRHPVGIASQMEAMESAYKGRVVKRRPTRLFTEIANLFWNDNKRYQDLLNEAKVMAKPYSKNEESFMSWLSERVPKHLQATYYLTLKENIERWAKGAGLIKTSLCDEIDLQKLERIRAYVVGARSYKLLFKRERERVQETLDHLGQYLREQEERKAALRSWASPNPDAARGEAGGRDAAQAGASDAKGEGASDDAGEGTRRVLDFEALDSAGALPKVEALTLSYFGEKKAEKNWTSLYVDALSFLRKDYSLKFAIMRLESLDAKGKSWLVDEDRAYRLTSCAQIAADYYVETGRSDLDLMKNLKWVLDQCAVDYENVVVAYASSEPEIEAEEEAEAEGVEEEADVADDEEEIDDLAIRNDESEYPLMPRDDEEATDGEEEGDDEIDDLELGGEDEYGGEESVEEESVETDESEDEAEESDFFDGLFDETSSEPPRDSKGAESKLPDGQETVDFENLDDMRFTRPISLKYFEDEPLFEATWKEVLVDACRYLFKDYASKFLQMRTASLAGRSDQKRIWLADESHKNALRESREIVKGFYVETNNSASRIVGLLKWILDQCDVDYKNLRIIYVRREKDSPDVALPGASKVAAKEERRAPQVAQTAQVANDEEEDEDDREKKTRARMPEPEELMDDEPEGDYELVDFENLASFAFTKPVFLRYFGRKYKVESWRNVLVLACRLLFRDNSDLFEIVREDCVSGDRNPLVADVKNRARQISSKEFVPGYFVEINFSAIDVLKRLKWLLDECGVDYRNLAVAYESTNVSKSKPAPAPEIKPAPEPEPPVPSPYEVKDKETFRRWLVAERGMSEEKAADLASCVERAESLAAGFGLASTRLYTDDVAEAKETEKALFSNPFVIQFDEGQNRSFRDAITALMEFYGVGEIETPKRVSVVDSGFRSRLENGFMSYLKSQIKLADKTATDCCRAVEVVERFLSDNGLNYSLDSSDSKEVERVYDVLMNREDFVSWNFRSHHRYSSAVAKYADYLRFSESGVDDFSEAEPKENADKEEIATAAPTSETTTATDLIGSMDVRKAFRRWMLDDQGMTELTSQSYVQIVTRAEKFALYRGLSSRRLYTDDFAEAKATMNALYRNAEFAQRDRDQDGRFHKALAKLMDFYAAGGDALIERQKTAPTPVASPVPAPRTYTRDAEGFQRWLVDAQGAAEATSKQIVSAIKSAERFAIDRRLPSLWLFTDSVDKAKATAKALFAHPGFIEYDRAKNGRFSRAIAKLMSFYDAAGVRSAPRVAAAPTSFARRDARQEPLFDAPLPLQERPNAAPATAPGYASADEDEEFNVGALVEIVAGFGRKGFRLNSEIEMRKLRRRYREATGRELDASPRRIENALKRRGIEIGDFLFIPDAILSEETREKILDYIAARFDEGRSAVYYDALLEKFYDELADSPFHENREALKAWLQFCVGSQCGFRKLCLTCDLYGKPNPNAEIRECLTERGVPMEFAEICSLLDHLGSATIKDAIYHNLEFVKNGKGEFFHADSLELSQTELEGIANLIENEIAERRHLTGADLVELIRRKFPNAYERNEVFSDSGWRDALKYKLEGRFSFSGDLVSAVGQERKFKTNVFADLGKTRRAFTLDELEEFAKSYNSPIAYEALYETARRVGYDQFVAKEELSFNVEETDAVLARLCPGNYVSFQEIVEFSVFPEASHRWNEYLLEQYVAFYSREFSIAHRAYNKNVVAGAIVRKSRRYADFDAAMADVLADSGVPLTKSAALEYLYEAGYVPTRSFAGIEKVLLNAQVKRNQRGR